jgi:hypothetical protein
VANPHEQEATAWVSAEIARLRAASYTDLLALQGQAEHQPREATDGRQLVLETQVFWDDSEHRNLRVLVDVWDPSWRLVIRSIAKDSFIRAPDGSLVGE